MALAGVDVDVETIRLGRWLLAVGHWPLAVRCATTLPASAPRVVSQAVAYGPRPTASYGFGPIAIPQGTEPTGTFPSTVIVATSITVTVLSGPLAV